MSIFMIRSLTKSLQSTGKRGFQKWTDRQTDIATYRLNWPEGQFGENKNKKFHSCFPLQQLRNIVFILVEYPQKKKKF